MVFNQIDGGIFSAIAASFCEFNYWASIVFYGCGDRQFTKLNASIYSMENRKCE